MRQLRWKRSIVVGIGVFAIAGLFATAPLALRPVREYFANRITPRVADPDEAFRIIAAAIELARLEGIPPPPPAPGEAAPPKVRKPIVLVAESIAVCDDDPEPPEGCPTMESDRMFVSPGADASIPNRFRRELVSGNREVRRIHCRASAWIQCSDRRTVDAVFAGDGWWDDFYDRFPGTAGRVEASVPVLSADGQQALIYLSFSCDGLCGHGRLFLMQRVGPSWRIAREELLWLS
jgi:hypothetical protein